MPQTVPLSGALGEARINFAIPAIEVLKRTRYTSFRGGQTVQRTSPSPPPVNFTITSH
jgi:hypothetical protein